MRFFHQLILLFLNCNKVSKITRINLVNKTHFFNLIMYIFNYTI